MSTAHTACPSCGHLNTKDAMFCSRCGQRLSSGSGDGGESPQAETTKEGLGAEVEAATGPTLEAPVQPQPDPGPAEVTTPDAPPAATGGPKRTPAQTMVGMPTPLGGPPVPAPSSAPSSAAPASSMDLQPSSPTEAHPGSAAPRARHAPTMMGMAAGPPPAEMNQPDEDRPSLEPRAGEVLSAPPLKRDLGPSNRTMLGQPAPRVDDLIESDAPAHSPHGAPQFTTADSPSDEASVPRSRGPARTVALLVLGLGIVALLVGGGALGYTLLRGGSQVRAEILHTDDGERIAIEVPGAADGTRVRFRGTEEPLAAGRALFEVPADEMRLGDNEFTVDIVEPGGDTRTESVSFRVDFRVRADLGPLTRAPPAIDIIVEAPPGSEATLNGEPLTLNAQGSGTQRMVIDPQDADAEGLLDHAVSYRIQLPEAQTAQGELHTRIPLTTMQIDRPGEQLVTDADSVEIAGAVAPNSTVRVEGTEVPVQEGHFLHRYSLPELGEHTVSVVAYAPGRAPRIRRIQIRRVADLREEAARFEVNESLTYGRLAQNPATYRGQPVRFEGTAFNVEVRQGRSVLQILVEPCPQENCPLWITYPAATDAELHSRVQVLGVVAGEQQFRSRSGQVRTHPRVDATFILPVSSPRRR